MVECHFYPFFEKKITWGIVSSGIQSMVNDAFYSNSMMRFCFVFLFLMMMRSYLNLMMCFILIYSKLYSFKALFIQDFIYSKLYFYPHSHHSQ